MISTHESTNTTLPPACMQEPNDQGRRYLVESVYHHRAPIHIGEYTSKQAAMQQVARLLNTPYRRGRRNLRIVDGSTYDPVLWVMARQQTVDAYKVYAGNNCMTTERFYAEFGV